MNKENFESLKQSLVEAGEIVRGEKLPSREFTIEVDPSHLKNQNTQGFAVCIESDDSDSLILHKIYAVTFHGGRYISFKDEAGETAVYPSDFFIKIDLPKEIEHALEEAA